MTGDMEIQALKLVLVEAEINRLAARAQRKGVPVRDLSVRLTAEGIQVTGKYHAFVSMAFETLWHVSVQAGKVRAFLADIKVVGFGAGRMKGMLTESLCAAVDAEGVLEADGDALIFDLDRLLTLQGFPAKTNLTAIRCDATRIVIEAALQPAAG